MGVKTHAKQCIVFSTALASAQDEEKDIQTPHPKQRAEFAYRRMGKRRVFFRCLLRREPFPKCIPHMRGCVEDVDPRHFQSRFF